MYTNGLREAQQKHGKETEEHQVVDLTKSVQVKEQNKTPFTPIKQREIRHIQQERRQCNQCSRTFPDRTTLKIHERTHDNYMKHKKRKVRYSPIRQRR